MPNQDKSKFYVVGMWCTDDNMPYVWSNDGTKTVDVKEFDNKEDAISFISNQIDSNIYISWTISKFHPISWKKTLSKYDKFKIQE